MTNEEFIVRKVILELDKPFKMSELFDKLSAYGISDRVMVLTVLNSLLDNGLVQCSDVEDDMVVYCSALV